MERTKVWKRPHCARHVGQTEPKLDADDATGFWPRPLLSPLARVPSSNALPAHPARPSALSFVPFRSYAMAAASFSDGIGIANLPNQVSVWVYMHDVGRQRVWDCLC